MRKHRSASRRNLVLVVLILIVAMVLLAYRHKSLLEKGIENATYFLNPTAERAYALGIKHFDGLSSKEFDVSRAETFFDDALTINPNYPMAHYQLARIAFLRSHFNTALFLVSEEFAANPHPDTSIYYLRALIEGYAGDYTEAEKDYEMYFKVTPANWAGINDYSWVLLKDNLPEGAHAALTWGLKQWPENAWLLTNDATALYEMGRYEEAAAQAKKAIPAVSALSVNDWLNAYPGNDPLIAEEGLASFKKDSEENLQKILAKAK
jgi:tetratricopeptide (TPR) repeat protein